MKSPQAVVIGMSHGSLTGLQASLGAATLIRINKGTYPGSLIGPFKRLVKSNGSMALRLPSWTFVEAGGARGGAARTIFDDRERKAQRRRTKTFMSGNAVTLN